MMGDVVIRWFEEEPVPKGMKVSEEVISKLKDFVEGKSDYVLLYRDSYTEISLCREKEVDGDG